MKARSTPRVFIGLREMSGYYVQLKRGFDALGVEAVFLDLGGHPFLYGDPGNPPAIAWLTHLSQKLGRFFFRNLLLRVLWTAVVQNIFGLLAFCWAAPRFDAFVFSSNSSFFFFLDLPVLRLLNKKILYVLHGSESRPVYLNGYVLPDERPPTIILGIVLARIQKTVVRLLERFATCLISIPPQAHFHGRPFVPWWIMGIPHPKVAAGIDPTEGRGDPLPRRGESGPGMTGAAVRTSCEGRGGPRPEREAPGPVRIIHAPSKPGPKGTEQIRQIVRDLKKAGHAIDYVELTGRPNAEVLAELACCDFVVDELYSDTPMAVFAAEAAFFGRPAVVGSYYAQQIHRDVAPEHIPPSLFVAPEEVPEAIRRLVEDRAFREDLGAKARAFVLSRWSAPEVARRYLALLQGDIPPSWLCDPHRISYLHGCGLTEARARRLVSAFVRMGGAGSLCLHDKPRLRDALLSFAAGNAP